MKHRKRLRFHPKVIKIIDHGKVLYEEANGQCYLGYLTDVVIKTMKARPPVTEQFFTHAQPRGAEVPDKARYDMLVMALERKYRGLKVREL